MHNYNSWYVYRVLICQIYIYGNLGANEFGEIIWDEVNIGMIILFSSRQKCAYTKYENK